MISSIKIQVQNPTNHMNFRLVTRIRKLKFNDSYKNFISFGIKQGLVKKLKKNEIA